MTQSQNDLLDEFVQSGGHVISWNPSLTTPDYLNHLSEFVTLDVISSPIQKDLRVTHIVKDNTHFYLFVNEGNSSIDCKVTVSEKGDRELWDAWSGKVQVISSKGPVTLHLDTRDSIILTVNTNGVNL